MFTKASPRTENTVKFPFPAAVYKLSEIRIDNDTRRVHVRVRAYADAEALTLCESSDTNAGPGPMPGTGSSGHIAERNHTLKQSDLADLSPATIEAAVMALPEYAGAVAV